jgi:hypothetical protein
LPTIGQVLGALEAQLFVGRERELAHFRQWLRAEAPEPVILNVTGPGGVGKTMLLHALRRVAQELGRPVVLADAQEFGADPQGLLRALGGSRLEDVIAALNETRPLLLLDTFEDLGTLAHSLREEILPRLETEVKVLIASRYPLSRAWRHDHLWHRLVCALSLKRFSPAESRLYLARRGLDEPRLVEGIVEATHGHPLALSLAADLVVELGVCDLTAAPEWHLIQRTLVERLLRVIPDPHLRALLEACAVVHQFDEPLLATVAGQEDPRAFEHLCHLSVVRPAEHGLMLHEDVRWILAEDLRWRRPERANEMRLRALAHYRERMRAAPAAEREWLVRERLGLWENGLLQALDVSAEAPGEVWLEPGGAGDHADLRHVWSGFSRRPDCPPPEALSLHMLEALLRYEGAQIRVARDRHGRALGFGLVLAVCRDSLRLLPPAGTRLVEAYWGPTGMSDLPAVPGETSIFYHSCFVLGDVEPEATAAALLRWCVGLFALSGTHLASIAWPRYKEIVETLGFQRVPEARLSPTSGEHPIDGYVLDLARIGVEAWFEAVMSGRPLPARLHPEELERELHAALLHWYDDTALDRLPLARCVPMGSGPEALRQAIRDALERARARAAPLQELAYRALELAYMQKSISHERAAERLAVSRTTFYRLLKRAVRGLAEAWGRAGAWQDTVAAPVAPRP